MLPTLLGMCLSAACSTEEPAAAAKATPDTPAEVRSEAKMKSVGVQTLLPAEAACDVERWCAPRLAAKRIAVTSLPRSLGCPATVGAEKLVPHIGTPAYASFPDVLDPLTFDLAATRALRGSGDLETCCYEHPCASTKKTDPRSAVSGR